MVYLWYAAASAPRNRIYPQAGRAMATPTSVSRSLSAPPFFSPLLPHCTGWGWAQARPFEGTPSHPRYIINPCCRKANRAYHQKCTIMLDRLQAANAFNPPAGGQALVSHPRQAKVFLLYLSVFTSGLWPDSSAARGL